MCVGSSLGMLSLSCLLDIQVEVPSRQLKYKSRAQDRGQSIYIIIGLGVMGKWVVFKAMGLAEIIKGDNGD